MVLRLSVSAQCRKPSPYNEICHLPLDVRFPRQTIHLLRPGETCVRILQDRQRFQVWDRNEMVEVGDVWQLA